MRGAVAASWAEGTTGHDDRKPMLDFAATEALLSCESLIVERRDWGVYAASALGLFPNMLLVYWAAQFIPSGLMSVIMGTYPFFVGAFSLLVLRENFFKMFSRNWCWEWAAMSQGLAGLRRA